MGEKLLAASRRRQPCSLSSTKTCPHKHNTQHHGELSSAISRDQETINRKDSNSFCHPGTCTGSRLKIKQWLQCDYSCSASKKASNTDGILVQVLASLSLSVVWQYSTSGFWLLEAASRYLNTWHWERRWQNTDPWFAGSVAQKALTGWPPVRSVKPT